MRNISLILFTISVLFAFSSCEKIEEDPYKRVAGKWVIKSASIGSITSPEDGSYLEFESCDGSDCTGIDYKASDGTTGTFEYSITEGDRTLFFFTDTTSDGGYYNGEYEATLFNNSSLNLEAESLLGTFRLEMKKED